MRPQLPPAIKYIIIACAVMFVLTSFGAQGEIFAFLGLVPPAVITKLFVWQPVTYLFLHANFWHIFMNMFILWMFGSELEKLWGSREFLRFFLITGVGAGLLSIAVSPFAWVATVGASGAVYGILIACAMLFPNRIVLLLFVFPIKMKFMVMGLAGLALLSALNQAASPIAHFAHLGGMIFGFLYLKGWLSIPAIRQSYYKWKIRRMRSRFQVYENKPKRRSKDDDFWIH